MSWNVAACNMLAGLMLGCVMPAMAASSDWKPDQNVEIVVPTGAGSGSDRTARFMQRLLQENKLIEVPIVVVNKPGGGGAVGLAYLNQHAGSGRHILLTSPSLLTNHITGKTQITYRDLTPLAIIGTEYVAFSVHADSPIKTGADLVARTKTGMASLRRSLSSTNGRRKPTSACSRTSTSRLRRRAARWMRFTRSLEKSWGSWDWRSSRLDGASQCGNTGRHLAWGATTRSTLLGLLRGECASAKRPRPTPLESHNSSASRVPPGKSNSTST